MRPFARIILVSSLVLAAGCCTVDRTGEYYVATKTLTGQARCPDGLIPSVGALLAMIGAEYPFPFIVLAPPLAPLYMVRKSSSLRRSGTRFACQKTTSAIVRSM